MENEAIQFEDGSSVGLSEEELVLNGVRNDFYVRASSDLADVIQAGIGQVHTGPNRGVKRAGFHVLVGALMPAVLAEIAFISHPEESRMLGRTQFQDDIVRALADSIDAYFDSHEHLWSGLQ
jgi:N-acetylmuramoyl-L-alanine amidase